MKLPDGWVTSHTVREGDQLICQLSLTDEAVAELRRRLEAGEVSVTPLP